LPAPGPVRETLYSGHILDYAITVAGCEVTNVTNNAYVAIWREINVLVVDAPVIPERPLKAIVRHFLERLFWKSESADADELNYGAIILDNCPVSLQT
jgi:hypothetical protein